MEQNISSTRQDMPEETIRKADAESAKSHTWTGKNTFSADYSKQNSISKEYRQQSSFARDSKWDTVKFFMILCVVFGHILYYFTGNDFTSKGIYFFIYSFHIPVFVFLSGMFSKTVITQKKWEKSFYYIILYLLLKTGIAVIRSIKTGEISLHFLWDSTPAWYLLAMAVYFLVTMLFLSKWDLKRIFMAALFLGCIAGCDNHFGDHYASMRIATFYPFFLLGYTMKPDTLRTFVNKKHIKYPAMIFLLFSLFFSIHFSPVLYGYIQLLKGRTTYESMGLPGISGILIRATYYAVTFLLVFCVLSVIPAMKGLPANIGKNTLIVYLIHPLIVTLCFEVFEGGKFIRSLWPTFTIPAVFLLSLILVLILGSFKLPKK